MWIVWSDRGQLMIDLLLELVVLLELGQVEDLELLFELCLDLALELETVPVLASWQYLKL